MKVAGPQVQSRDHTHTKVDDGDWLITFLGFGRTGMSYSGIYRWTRGGYRGNSGARGDYERGAMPAAGCSTW
ncbi:hypothetical protein EAE99_010608 [Botrytis elliptica]|nr:hypothetical protein EAE99_010608 [Botrytis elliptica]